MSLTYTTLEYNGQEMTLADWGGQTWTYDRKNQDGDYFRLTVTAMMDGPDLFPDKSNIIIRILRVPSAVNPVNPTVPVSVNQMEGLTFSGGVQWFVGYCAGNDRVGDPNFEQFLYEFQGPYKWFFGRTKFQQLQLTWNNSPATGKPRYFADWRPNVILGMSLNTLTGAGDTVQGTTATNLMSFAQTIKQICQFAQTAATAEYGSAQFASDSLTTAINGVDYDLLNTPSANVLIKDYFSGSLIGKTSTMNVTDAHYVNGLVVPGTMPTNKGSFVLRPPLDAVTGMYCDECMKRVLQWLGGLGAPQIWTDYSQTPPQLRFATPDEIATPDPGDTTTEQRMGGGYILDLPLTGLTIAGKIKTCYRLIPPAVHFKYQVAGSFLGAPDGCTINDVAAYLNADGTVGTPGAAGVQLYEGVGTVGSLFDVNNPTTLLSGPIQDGLMAAALLPQAIVELIDIQGSQTNGQSATITTSAINPVDPAGTNADGGWWQTFVSHFANATKLKFYDPVNCPVSYTDPTTKAPIDVSGLPYRLPDGQLAPWMTSGASPIVTKKVRVTGYFSYQENAPGKNTVPGSFVQRKEEFCDLTLTNAVSGTYSVINSVNPGEPIPFGLAGYILTLETIKQYQGEFSFQETEITDICPPGNRFNITGGLAEWATMAAQFPSVSYNDKGHTRVTFGPAKHLSGAQLVARFKNNIGLRWYLLISTNPMQTSNGLAQTPPNVAMQAGAPGAKDLSFQQLLTSLPAYQAAPGTTLPAGLTLDAGAGAGPADFGTGKFLTGVRALFAQNKKLAGFHIAQGPTTAGSVITPGESNAFIRLYLGDLCDNNGAPILVTTPNGQQAIAVYLREEVYCHPTYGPGFRLVQESQYYTVSIRGNKPDN